MTFPSIKHNFLPLFICVPHWLVLSSVAVSGNYWHLKCWLWGYWNWTNTASCSSAVWRHTALSTSHSSSLLGAFVVLLGWGFTPLIQRMVYPCLLVVGGLGWASSLSRDLGDIFSWNQGSCVTRSGTFHLRKGKNAIRLFCSSAVTGMGELLSPHQKTQPSHGLGSHWLNLRAKNAENMWKSPGRKKPQKENCTSFHIWLWCEEPVLREIFAMVLLIKPAEQIASY